MSVLKMFAIRDSQTGIYDRPFADLTNESAIRMFRTTINTRKDYLFAQYPEHFDLFWLGDYDQRTGKMSCPDTPLHMAKALDLVDARHEPPPPLSKVEPVVTRQ